MKFGALLFMDHPRIIIIVVVIIIFKCPQPGVKNQRAKIKD